MTYQVPLKLNLKKSLRPLSKTLICPGLEFLMLILVRCLLKISTCENRNLVPSISGVLDSVLGIQEKTDPRNLPSLRMSNSMIVYLLIVSSLVYYFEDANWKE